MTLWLSSRSNRIQGLKVLYLNVDLSAPLSQIRLWSDSEKELQYGNSNFQISLTTNDKNNQKPEDQGVSIEEFQKGLPETATNNFFSNKLPEILETLNDQEDDDSEEYFNEFDGRLEISKPIRSIPALEVELSHHSIQDVEIPFQKIEKVPEIFIFKRHEKTNESAFMSCPPGFSGPEFGTSNASINKPIFNHPERLTLPLGSPSSRHERVFNIDNTGVRSSLDTPPSCKVSRPDKSSSFGGRTHSLKSSHTFTPTNRYSHARQINKDDISSEDCIGDKNEECAESYGSEDFHTALELDEQPSEFDLVCHMSDSSEQSGMIKLRHTSLLKNGAVEMKKLAHVFYQGEKPSGFNPQFTNGRVLFQNSMLALKITNASLSSFGNAFYSGATSRKEKVIIFDVNLENVGESTIIVFSATPKDPNGIKLECEQGPWTEK